MSICEYCCEEMLDPKTVTCLANTITVYPDGEKLPSVPYENNYVDESEKASHRCGCNVKLGMMHHRGCDMERCPRCRGQLISCGCLKNKLSPLNDLGWEILDINSTNGWNVTTRTCWASDYKIPAVLALIHSEVSEALEAFRNDNPDNFVDEMADIIIRILDCTAGMGIDIDAAIAAKLEANKKRGYRHGGKRI